MSEFLLVFLCFCLMFRFFYSISCYKANAFGCVYIYMWMCVYVFSFSFFDNI